MGCEPCHYSEAEPWLTVTLKDGESEPTIEESKALGLLSSSTNSAKE